VHRPDGCCVRELVDRIDDPVPHCYAGMVTGCLELAYSSRAFHLGRVAIPTKHQVGGAPDIDLGDHAAKVARACL
jgi:hypothetical protein